MLDDGAARPLMPAPDAPPSPGRSARKTGENDLVCTGGAAPGSLAECAPRVADGREGGLFPGSATAGVSQLIKQQDLLAFQYRSLESGFICQRQPASC